MFLPYFFKGHFVGRLSLRNSSVVDRKTPVLLAVIASTDAAGNECTECTHILTHAPYSPGKLVTLWSKVNSEVEIFWMVRIACRWSREWLIMFLFFLTVNFVKVKLFVALVERRHAEPFCWKTPRPLNFPAMKKWKLWKITSALISREECHDMIDEFDVDFSNKIAPQNRAMNDL